MRRQSINNKKGFTLIEMIIALSIFVLILLIATNVFVIINRSQRKVAAAQKIQDDVRYMMEVMAQDIRLGRINYDFYSDISNGVDLHPSADTQPVRILALINQANQDIFYRWDSANQRMQYCKEVTLNECDLDTGGGWNDLTPNGVSIEDLRFVITPTADPFTGITPTLCATAGKLGCQNVYGYSCPSPGSNCVYFTDGQHFQPKVRIIIQSVADDPSLPVVSRTLNLQSIVSSRLILGQVKNTYHD
ncbi:MAG: prepilin-type N-terminal cleavage/methylation domain-containing protein [Patescibacteria group bacterium]